MQHPQGIPASTSTSSSNSELEAMKSAHDDAVNTNEKIFPIFAKKLASKDTNDYMNTMRKLTIWLSSEKAYYQVARPKIVQLLETALSTFKETFVQHANVSEFAEPLRLLIGSILPFVRLFTEAELRSRLHRVIIDAQLALDRVGASKLPLQEPANSLISPHPPPMPGILATSVSPQLKMLPPPVAQSPVLHVQLPSVPGPSVVNAVIESSPQNATPQARHPVDAASSPTDIKPPLCSPIATTSRQPIENGNVSPSIPSKPQPRRARRAELSEELIARDLDWFKSNQTPGVASQRGPGASTPQVGEPLPGVANAPTLSSSPKKKTARMVPSRRLPRRISLETGQNVDVSVSDFGIPPASPPLADAHAGDPRADGHLLFQEGTGLARSVPIAESSGMASHEPTSAETQPVASTSSESAVKPEIHPTELQVPLVKAPLLKGTYTMSPTALLDASMESMDISVSGSESMLSESPPKTGSTPPPSPLMLRLRGPILPPLVRSWEPPLNLNFDVSQIASDQVQESPTDANRQRFDGQMTVIHCTQAKPFTHTHVIDISLNENMFALVAKWVNRKSDPSEAVRGVCLSLACYRLPEFFGTIKSESERLDIETLTSRSSCAWPRSNRMSLRVNEGTKQTVITLAPPLFLTPDQCVDISSLMKLGDNRLELRQFGDLSEYLVVLHAHHPTRTQLAALHVVTMADERWRRFLDVISARVVPERVVSAGTAVGVV